MYETDILINAFSHLTDHHIKAVIQCHYFLVLIPSILHLISLK